MQGQSLETMLFFNLFNHKKLRLFNIKAWKRLKMTHISLHPPLTNTNNAFFGTSIRKGFFFSQGRASSVDAMLEERLETPNLGKV